MADARKLLPDEKIPEAHLAQTFYESGPKVGQAAVGSSKVGFTLRDASGDVVDAMAFLINPQGLQRADGSRSTLFGTRAGWLVDNFGAAPGTIQLRQLVASGKNLGHDGLIYTAREDVQRFIRNIYLPSMHATGPARKVYFHDHHFERGMEQQVWFPAGSLNIDRSVEANNVWRVDLQMVSLEKNPYKDLVAQPVSTRHTGRSYQVKKGDSLASLVTRLAGKNVPSFVRAQVQARLVSLNPKLSKARQKPGDPAGTKNAKPLKLYPGEIILLPG